VEQPVVAVVVPAYRAAERIASVLLAMPPSVRHVIVVDDASPDALAQVVATLRDPRIVLLRHQTNRGVGAAVKTGAAHALALGADIVVKVDADGQMDPARVGELLAPLLAGSADLAKGNRFVDTGTSAGMPFVRRLGNLALSFLVKAASGYWNVFDPCNGYLAVRASLLGRIAPERLADRFFFEISLLCEAYLARAVVRDVAIPAVYGDETSSLAPLTTVLEFLPRLLARIVRRIRISYFLRDFNVVSVFLTCGVPLLLFGAAWSLYHWYLSFRTGVVATTGTVIIGTLAIILGFQLLLQAVVLDVQNEPGR
jgi:glycosyltransferase involved in cell wall biosynthesis